MIIEDGTGKGNATKVADNNRLYCNSIVQNVANFHNEDGDRYNINTDTITLTSDSESALLYIKNNDSRHLIVDAVVFMLAASTGGSGQVFAYIHRNPTGGTIVSDATDAAINSNLNYGSNNTLTADIYMGGEGKTQTGSTRSLSSIMSPPTTNIVSVGDIILPKGQSISVTVQPPSGNTSMVVHIAALIYSQNEALA